jgi:phage terminase small subunit
VKTGRSSYATFDVVPYGEGKRRLSPPASLGEAEKRAFLDLVTACPTDQFQPSDRDLLCAWCELVVVRERAAKLLEVEGMVTADGKPSPWLKVHQDAAKGLSGLALRLRLGPQSRAQKAPRVQVGPVSYYEKVALLEGSYDATDDGDSGPDRGRS